jgi:hypothetical protein
MHGGLYYLKNVLESTSYLLPLASKNILLNNVLQKLWEYQLSFACLVVPFWLAVQRGLEI